MLRVSLLFFLLFCFCAKGQDRNHTIFSENDQEILNSMRVDISAMRGFQISLGHPMECFERKPVLFEAFTCMNNKLTSVDRDCVVFIPLHRLFNREDSLFFNKLTNAERSFNPNQVHFFNLKRQIAVLDGNSLNWTKSLSYLPLDKAKEWFNADSVIYFQKVLTTEQCYQDEFDALLSVMFHKRDRGFVNVIIFYKTRSRWGSKELLERLSRTIIYRD